MQPYDESFFATCEAESSTSARQVVPLVVQLLSPKSVVDVGCGIGAWLVEFRNAGVDDFLGIDGAYVNKSQLLIEQNRFVSHDLTQPLDIPASHRRQFDLAVSLEVAEHLDAKYAAQFVSGLASAAPAVLFSAAIPYQGGTHHVNEQWPTYWARLFAEHQFVAVDWVRPRLMNNPQVAYYYAQNSLLFIAAAQLQRWPELQPYVKSADDGSLCCVHPALWMKRNNLRAQPLGRVLTALQYSVRNAVARRVLRKPSKFPTPGTA
jgi:SAM-dependent methyltransferase